MVGRRDLLKRVGAAGAVVVGGGAAVAVAEASGTNGTAVVPGPRSVALIVLDRSGSMSKVRDATVKGLNAYIDAQREIDDLHLGLIQFDAVVHGNLDITPTLEFTLARDCPRLGRNDYLPRGGTPLLAAVAEAIKRLEAVVRPQDRALLIVQTDGWENSSPAEITKAVIKDLIAAKTAEGNWTFVFMGADIDAWGEGGSIGVAAHNTQSYANTNQGTQAIYAVTAAATATWATNRTESATMNFYSGTASAAPADAVVDLLKDRKQKHSKDKDTGAN